MYLSLSLSLSLYLSLSLSFLVRSCLLITLIKCLKGHKSLGSLCSVVKTLIVVVTDQPMDQGTNQGTRSPIELFWTAKNIRCIFLWVSGEPGRVSSRQFELFSLDVLQSLQLHKYVLVLYFQNIRLQCIYVIYLRTVVHHQDSLN